MDRKIVIFDHLLQSVLVSYRGLTTVSRKLNKKDWMPWSSHGMTPNDIKKQGK
ncbi:MULTISPECIES: hypothetical protein [unclassified Rickettsia]|uniref:hypothetical protein n=1 Tax=unclassified Rickettsia TaxID=114295 RepID=UPI0031329FAB